MPGANEVRVVTEVDKERLVTVDGMQTEELVVMGPTGEELDEVIGPTGELPLAEAVDEPSCW